LSETDSESPGTSVNSARLRATLPDQVWAIDFQFAKTTGLLHE